ncbi:hypothetical protein GCM10007231_11920 [Nocardioides daphniae]|uniref:Uncharacterized protein n=1 Tax=Nocardioides daphniae TaxID=402297 RepID=A0ABQ1Q6X8_9ACTN|nr:hypothetical protein GCM10007231_11920 [Nocardioides daphniae]
MKTTPKSLVGTTPVLPATSCTESLPDPANAGAAAATVIAGTAHAAVPTSRRLDIGRDGVGSTWTCARFDNC